MKRQGLLARRKFFEYFTYLSEELPNINLEEKDELDALLPWPNLLPEYLKLETKKEN